MEMRPPVKTSRLGFLSACLFIAAASPYGWTAAHAQAISFTDRTQEAGLSGISGSNGLAVADFDNDGWQDLAVARNGYPVALIGGSSWRSQISPVVHVGLGKAAAIDEVTVYWGQDQVERFGSLAVNTHYSVVQAVGIATGKERGAVPAVPAGLESVYPNPIESVATVAFVLDRPMPVRVDVYDLLGRHAAALAEGLQPAERQVVQLDAQELANGFYLLHFVAGSRRETRIIVVRK